MLYSNLNSKWQDKQETVVQKNVEIMVPLKYLSNFWRTLEMPLINCKISFHLKWSKNSILVAGTANNENPSF